MAVGEERRDFERVLNGCISIPVAMNENNGDFALNGISEFVAEIRTWSMSAVAERSGLVTSLAASEPSEVILEVGVAVGVGVQRAVHRVIGVEPLF